MTTGIFSRWRPIPHSGRTNIWTLSLTQYLPLKAQATGGAIYGTENVVFICPTAQSVYVNLGTNQVVRTYACTGTMLGTQSGGSGLTATLPGNLPALSRN